MYRPLLITATALALSSTSFASAQSAPSSQPTSVHCQFEAINADLADTASKLLDLAETPDSDVHHPPENSSTPETKPQHPLAFRNTPTSAVSRLQSIRSQIDPVLRAQGLPVELAAVVLVESGVNPTALSPKGARGLWQLMPQTARRYGLTVDDTHDDRLDIEKSTQAAARYLNDLHLQFGSWPLALAAYNTGEQNLRRAIDLSHSTDFAVLSSLRLLPLETRSYVPAVLSVIGSEIHRESPTNPSLTFTGGTRTFALSSVPTLQ